MEHNPAQQDLAHSSHLNYNNQGQVLDKTGNQADNGINVTVVINLECLSENIPSTSTCSNTPAKKETLDKLKLDIILKEKKLGKHKKIELIKQKEKN